MSDLAYAAEAATALESIAENDGLRAFVAHAKQQLFLSCLKREVMMLGANRTGKSLVASAYIARKFRQDGARKGALICPSFAMARQNIIPVLFGDADHKPMIPPSEIAHVREKPDWVYEGKDGWQLLILSDEQGAAKIAGLALDFIVYDEPPSWPVYNEGAIRFAAGKQCDIRLCATLLPPPGQAGGICQWLWAEKIEPWLAGKAPHDLEIIQVSMSDNPHITDEQLALARRLYAPGSLDRRIRVDGELLPGLIGARCYARFDRRIHVNKQLSRKDVDPLKPLYLGCDFNVEPLCWGILQKHGHVWRKLDEITLRPGTIDEACDQVISRFGGHRNDLVICGDATSERRTAQTGKTDYDLMAGKLKDHFRLKFVIPDKNPPERDRVNLVNYFFGGGDADVRFEVSHTCSESIADFEQVLWAKDGSHIMKSRDKKEPYYQRTHHSDGDGYVLWARESHVIQKAARNAAPAPKWAQPPYYAFSG